MPRREVSTREIVVKSLENGKTVFIPYIYSDEKTKYKTMDMLQIRDLEDLNSLKPDAWGIPTLPKDSIESRRNALGGHGIRKDSHATQDSSKLDLIFVPAVAFDQSFRRLGHGKGFYDQYLETYQKSLQLDEKMPCLGKSPSSIRPIYKFLTHSAPVGLALTEQLLPLGHDIPTSDNDWNVNLVITAGRQTRNVAS